MESRVIDLTKKLSIVEVEHMKLERKYKALEDQEKLLRREYHSKDADMAEKDQFVQERINNLKAWKAKAIH